MALKAFVMYYNVKGTFRSTISLNKHRLPQSFLDEIFFVYSDVLSTAETFLSFHVHYPHILIARE